MRQIELDFKPVNINGINYYTIKQFAELVHHTEGSVRQLIAKGNRIRKLKAVKMLSKTFIPVSELTEFCFTYVGRGFNTIYKFTEEGVSYVIQVQD